MTLFPHVSTEMMKFRDLNCELAKESSKQTVVKQILWEGVFPILLAQGELPVSGSVRPSR